MSISGETWEAAAPLGGEESRGGFCGMLPGGEDRRAEGAQPRSHYHLIKYSSGQGLAATLRVLRGGNPWLVSPTPPNPPAAPQPVPSGRR